MCNYCMMAYLAYSKMMNHVEGDEQTDSQLAYERVYDEDLPRRAREVKLNYGSVFKELRNAYVKEKFRWLIALLFLLDFLLRLLLLPLGLRL